jgi:glycosyltransferase involved in cell wall biosynthesis
MARGLRAVFALYPQFDRLVSVSSSLSALNRKSLARRLDLEPSRFVSARNLVDADRVREGMREDLLGLDGHPMDEQTGVTTIPPWVDALRDHREPSWFVSVGRFSTEKNQARLIRAFATVHAARPEARLLIVGYGPLRAKLQELIDGLELTGAAFLAGPYPNPFPILAAADCFVLSSDYEGQPMVLLEAAIAGLPIVSVAFRSVRDALVDGELLVVEQDDTSLTGGMLSFLEGQLRPATLDVAAYMREATGEFLDAMVPGEILGSRRSDSSYPDEEEVTR